MTGGHGVVLRGAVLVAFCSQNLNEMPQRAANPRYDGRGALNFACCAAGLKDHFFFQFRLDNLV